MWDAYHSSIQLLVVCTESNQIFLRGGKLDKRRSLCIRHLNSFFDEHSSNLSLIQQLCSWSLLGYGGVDRLFHILLRLVR